jgi:hypothetical protein
MSRFFLSMLAALGLATILACGGTGGNGAPPVVPRTGPMIGYRMMPAAGLRKVIVIDPSHRNEKDLRVLGGNLREDYASEKFAMVMVFDDAKAAVMVRDVTQLNAADDAYYSKHFVAVYLRNDNSGVHTLTISLQGIDGPQIDVDYTKGKSP